MKVLTKQMLREAMNPEPQQEETAEGVNGAGQTEKEQEPLTARQILKRELEALNDPQEHMTEEEHAAYQKKLSAKLRSGKKLTAKEMSYLRFRCPSLYQLARRLEYKRLKMEHRLKQAKSKQEAEDIYNEMVGQVSKEDPDKEAILNTYKNTYEEFKKTVKYRQLPETREEAVAKELHGKKKKWYLEHKMISEFELWFEEEMTGGENGELVKLEDDVSSPIEELLDELPVLDVQG